LDTLPDYPYAGILIALAIGDQKPSMRGNGSCRAHRGVAPDVDFGSACHHGGELFAALLYWLWRRSSR